MTRTAREMTVSGTGTRKTSVVVAIGGNAIVKENQRGTVQEQLQNIYKSCEHIADLYEQGYNIVLIHGNGPQVGNLLLQNEGEKEVPQQPIDICGAMTQGQIGYMIQQSLTNILTKRGIDTRVVSITTQMVVSGDDPAFLDPSKPIGPFCTEARAQEIVANRPDIVMREDASRGFRRVVPSPQPLEMIEKDCAKALMAAGCIVITAGGGGIPVLRSKDGLRGVEAVIDKDRAAALVAKEIEADCLIILTGVDRVCVDFRKPTQREISIMTVEEAQRYYDEGQFPAGSMGPKIQSSIRYIREGGEKVIITSIEKLHEAMIGLNGTVIVNSL